MSCSHCQGVVSTSNLPPDWLHTSEQLIRSQVSSLVSSRLAPDWLNMSEQPIRSQVSKLTQLLTMTTTHRFPLQSGTQVVWALGWLCKCIEKYQFNCIGVIDPKIIIIACLMYLLKFLHNSLCPCLCVSYDLYFKLD